MSLRSPTYANYPPPICAPLESGATAQGAEIPYPELPLKNPALSGLPLRVAANLIANVGFLKNFFWKNANFGTLRFTKGLDAYNPRFDPTVIPFNGPVTAADADSHSLDRGADKCFYTSADYVDAYIGKRTTPTDVAKYLLEIIRQPPHDVAFIQVLPELVLEAAAASTRRYENGQPLGPLDGVPIAVKDEFDIHGYRRTYGSSKVFDLGKGQTSWCIKKLEDAGAIMIGKTNMHELGLDTTNNNPITGTPRNPYNKNYYTGGSSGGSGYAVGSGLVPIAIGADGGGSVRIPATYCGGYGIKPSHGRISGDPTTSLTVSNGVAGPLACSLYDLSLAYRIMSEPDPACASSFSFPRPLPSLAPNVPVPEKVLGVWRPWFNDCTPAVKKLCNAALDRLASAHGYKVVELPGIPHLSTARLGHALSIMSDIAAATGGCEDVSWMSAANKLLVSVGATTSAADFIAAQKVRAMMMSHFANVWSQYPGMIIVTPTMPASGAKIKPGDIGAGVSDADASIISMRFVFMANFIGTPAITAGVGYDDETNLQISMMGMGEWGTEEELLSFARDVENSREHPRRTGETWVDVLGDVQKTSAI